MNTLTNIILLLKFNEIKRMTIPQAT